RHVNEHGITFQEYRFNEYKNQIEKIAFYLGHETVAKWYGDYAIKSVRNVGDRLEEELDMRKVV
ncbi:hypothetical protein ACSLO2_27395, partial [Escherichia coli]